jgi:hypothetical protein
MKTTLKKTVIAGLTRNPVMSVNKCLTYFWRLRIKSAMTTTQAITVGLLLSIPAMLPAQHILQMELNIPREDDQLVKEQVTYCQSGESGENLTWSFGKLKWTNDYDVRYFSRDDLGLIGAENGNLFSYLFAEDSLLLLGYENPNNLVRYHEPGLLLKFPLTYGASSEGAFRGRGKHNDRFESIVSGTIQTLADATGTIILPGNDTLTNVVRIHIHKRETGYYSLISSDFDIERPLEENFFADTLQTKNPDLVVTDTYQWYGEGYRYPVFETVESYRYVAEDSISLRQESYFYHPEDQIYFLPEDTANIAVLEKKQAEKELNALQEEVTPTLHCYPNPVTSQLTVEIELVKSAHIRMQMRTSTGMLYKSQDMGFFKEGACILHSNVANLPVGNYVLDIWLDEKLISEIIMKR